MSEIKNSANAALSAARRQDATAKAHDEAQREVKDLLELRRRDTGDSIYGCETMRQKAPDHQHRLKNEAYCRELMALTTYTLRDDTVHLARLQLCRGAAGARGDPLPQAHREKPCKCTWSGCSYAASRQQDVNRHSARRHGTQ